MRVPPKPIAIFWFVILGLTLGGIVLALESPLAEWSAGGLAVGHRLSEPRRIALAILEGEGRVLPPNINMATVPPCVVGDTLTNSDAGFGYLDVDHLCTSAEMTSMSASCDPVRTVRRLVRPGPFTSFHSMQYTFVVHGHVAQIEKQILELHDSNRNLSVPFYQQDIATDTRQCTPDFGMIQIESEGIL
jgi:hypothetical protein